MTARPPGYYFGYGSNLSITQMRGRCPNAEPLALAHLNGPWAFQINERGFANVYSPPTPRAEDLAAVRERGHQPYINAHPTPGVYGMLYRLTSSDEHALDFHEFVPIAYQKQRMPVTIIYSTIEGLSAGVTVNALVYVDHRTSPGVARSEYVTRMNLGIDEAAGGWCLPAWYVEHVLRRFIPKDEEEDASLWGSPGK